MRTRICLVVFFCLGFFFITLHSHAIYINPISNHEKSDLVKKAGKNKVKRKNEHLSATNPTEHSKVKFVHTIMLLNPLFAHFRFFTPIVQKPDTLDA
jgi:hypothetical protein